MGDGCLLTALKYVVGISPVMRFEPAGCSVVSMASTSAGVLSKYSAEPAETVGRRRENDRERDRRRRRRRDEDRRGGRGEPVSRGDGCIAKAEMAGKERGGEAVEERVGDEEEAEWTEGSGAGEGARDGWRSRMVMGGRRWQSLSGAAALGGGEAAPAGDGGEATVGRRATTTATLSRTAPSECCGMGSGKGCLRCGQCDQRAAQQRWCVRSSRRCRRCGLAR